MKNKLLMLSFLVFLMACQASSMHKNESPKNQLLNTPAAIIDSSTEDEWRQLDVENTLYLKLSSGMVVLELLSDLAPNHVSNTKALIRQSVFDGSQFYRVIDGFVAQGGPEFDSEDEMKPLTSGSYSVSEELTFSGELAVDYTPFDWTDGYADETGFLNGFAVGRDLVSGEAWLLHCYGALGMGRANDLNSGGTELYVVNGQAQRYLDRNVTVFGRVILGMEHIQSLKRSEGIMGSVDLTGQNTIESIRVAADLPADEVMAIEVMKTNSNSFKKLLLARSNRSSSWFVYQHNYMGACGVPIPVRLKTG